MYYVFYTSILVKKHVERFVEYRVFHLKIFRAICKQTILTAIHDDVTSLCLISNSIKHSLISFSVMDTRRAFDQVYYTEDLYHATFTRLLNGYLHYKLRVALIYCGQFGLYKHNSCSRLRLPSIFSKLHIHTILYCQNQIQLQYP